MGATTFPQPTAMVGEGRVALPLGEAIPILHVASGGSSGSSGPRQTTHFCAKWFELRQVGYASCERAIRCGALKLVTIGDRRFRTALRLARFRFRFRPNE